MTPKSFRAVYRDGEFQPLEPVDFAEGKEVWLVIVRDKD